MKIKWNKIIEGSDLKRGTYLVTNGKKVKIFFHKNYGNDLSDKESRIYGKNGADWTHYALIENLPECQISTVETELPKRCQ